MAVVEESRRACFRANFGIPRCRRRRDIRPQCLRHGTIFSGPARVSSIVAGRQSMRLGVTFPQLASGTDPLALRDFVQAVEEIGFDHLLIYDHVLGADPTNRPGWRGNYTHESLFHEPLVFLGYVASMTTRLELVTGSSSSPNGRRRSSRSKPPTSTVFALADFVLASALAGMRSSFRR